MIKIKSMVNAQEKVEFSQVNSAIVLSEIQKVDAAKKTSGAVSTDKFQAWFPYDHKDRQRRKDRTIL